MGNLRHGVRGQVARQQAAIHLRYLPISRVEGRYSQSTVFVDNDAQSFEGCAAQVGCIGAFIASRPTNTLDSMLADARELNTSSL